MGDLFKLVGLATLGFVVLDGLWLGVVMKNFYRDQLASIARLADGGLAPLWSVAWIIYVLLGAGVALFVIPRANSASSAALSGALLGIVIYGVYDLTNYSTLAAWPLTVTIADIAWGTFATAVIAAAVYAMTAR